MKDDGGPAFPAPEAGQAHFGDPSAYIGMTLRDYFVAHAPAEPQPWFEPTMSTECPPDDWRSEDGEERFTNMYEARRVYGDSIVNSNDDAQFAWKCERDKQRYLQWPAVWADAMLEERSKQ
jgi:hypothetical protein